MKSVAPSKRKLSKKEWNLLIICIIISGVLLSDFAIRQTYLKFNRLREEIILTEERLGSLSRILRQREQIEAGYEGTIASLRQIETSDDFLKQIQGFAQEAGLNIRSIKPVAARKEELYKIYSLKLEAQNDISTLTKFLNVFTEGPNSIGVKRLQISAQRSNELPKVSLEISTVAFNN